MRPLFYLIILCTSLYGCGQAGPLYIPQQESQEERGEGMSHQHVQRAAEPAGGVDHQPAERRRAGGGQARRQERMTGDPARQE